MIYILLTIDLLVPLLVGLLHFIFFENDNTQINHLSPFLLFSISIIFISLIKNYYTNYFSTNFSDKLKISFVTTFSALFIHLVIYVFYSYSVSLHLFSSLLFIPFLILLFRYFLKNSYKKNNNIKIYIVGKFYQFNEYEINMLNDKGYKTFFLESYDEFKNNLHKINNEKSRIVINLSINDTSLLDFNTDQSIKMNLINLDDFLESYLRKVLPTSHSIINLKKYDRFDFILKRVIDLSSILIMLPILIVLTPVIYLSKKIYSINDSFFFAQKRLGFNMKIFNIYKIRTMKENSDTKGNTTKNDSRIYPFAKILRQLRIDELPQIINILLGDMHLVGPRAEWIKLSEEYYIKLKSYKYRHVVRPGITGWAQIIYPYGFNSYDAEQKLMYDLYYIKHWSIWLELEICFKTAIVILDKKGF